MNPPCRLESSKAAVVEVVVEKASRQLDCPQELTLPVWKNSGHANNEVHVYDGHSCLRFKV